jgi:hypothetical protein
MPPKFSEVIELLERNRKLIDEDVLPQLPPDAFARINAARERCDAIAEEAQNRYDEARAAERIKKPARQGNLLRQAHRQLESAKEKAAVLLLDAQAAEYLPLARLFPYHTLPTLVKTSLQMYGSPDPGGHIERALELRIKHWRARRWDLEAERAKQLAISEPTRHPHPSGFAADMERHLAIAAIVGQHCPDWRTEPKTWKQRNTLERICADLDAKSNDSSLYEIPRNWKEGKTQALRGAMATGWVDALKLAGPKIIVGQISSHLKNSLKALESKG